MMIQQVGNQVHSGLVPENQVPSPSTAKPNASAETQEAASHAAASVARPVDRGQLKEAVEKVNKTIRALSQDLQFTVDEQTGIDLVKVVDKETKEVIRQIPSEEMVAIAKRLDELRGLIIRQKA